MTRFSLVFMTLALLGCLDPDEPGNLVPKTVVEDRTLPRVEVNGTSIHAEAFGPTGAPTVIALHGGPGGDYRGMLPLRALADEGYRVVFWDQRGTGLSQRHDASVYSYAIYLEDLRQVIEKMASPGQPVVFVAHSWGAMYATWFINEHGDYGGRVRGAILSEPGAFTKRQLDRFIDDLESSFDFTGEQLNDAVWWGQFMSPEDHARADYQRTFFAIGGPPSEKNDRKNPMPLWRSGAVANSALIKLTEEQPFDWTTRLKAFAPKVLFLRGDLNTAVTLEHQKELASSFANAEIITMANVGHQMLWERPQEYLMHTRAYFNSIGFVGGAR